MKKTLLQQLVTTTVATLAYASSAQAALPLFEEGAKKFDFYGDFRYRYEMQTEDRTADRRSRTRQRGRLRFGGTYQASELVEAGFRLATGATSLHSPHATYGDLGGDAETTKHNNFGLDKLYISLNSGDFKATFGKQSLGLKQLSKSWMEGDYNPEGIAFKYKVKDTNFHAASYDAQYNSWDAANDSATLIGLDGTTELAGTKLEYVAANLSMTDNNADLSIHGGAASYNYLGVLAKISGFKLGLESFSSTVELTNLGAAAVASDTSGSVVTLRYKLNDDIGLRYYQYDIGNGSVPMAGAWAPDDFPVTSNFKGARIQVDYELEGAALDLRVYSVTPKNSSLAGVSADVLDGTAYNSITRTQLNMNVKF